MKRLIVSIAILVGLGCAAHAQGVTAAAPNANTVNAAPVPAANCPSGLEQWNSGWTCVTVGTGLSLSGSVLSATGTGGGGTTYTPGPGIAINGSAISINFPTVIWGGGSRALTAAGCPNSTPCDMMRENIVNGGAAVAITLPAPATVASGGNMTCFKVEGAGTALSFVGAPSDTPLVLIPGQEICMLADNSPSPAWHQIRGAGQ